MSSSQPYPFTGVVNRPGSGGARPGNKARWSSFAYLYGLLLIGVVLAEEEAGRDISRLVQNNDWWSIGLSPKRFTRRMLQVVPKAERLILKCKPTLQTPPLDALHNRIYFFFRQQAAGGGYEPRLTKDHYLRSIHWGKTAHQIRRAIKHHHTFTPEDVEAIALAAHREMNG